MFSRGLNFQHFRFRSLLLPCFGDAPLCPVPLGSCGFFLCGRTEHCDLSGFSCLVCAFLCCFCLFRILCFGDVLFRFAAFRFRRFFFRRTDNAYYAAFHGELQRILSRLPMGRFQQLMPFLRKADLHLFRKMGHRRHRKASDITA